MRCKFFLLAILAILLTLAACGNGRQENSPLVTLPPVIIADNAQISHHSHTSQSEGLLIPELDIPPFNEYTVFLDFEPGLRIIRGIESLRYTNRTGRYIDTLFFRVPYNFMDILHISKDNEELIYTVDETVLAVELSRSIEPDETIQIHIQFEAAIPKSALRIGANDRAVWAGGFLPTEEVSPFVLDVANYAVEITTPIGYTVAGTGIKTETYLDDQKITAFTAQMTRDFAFAISPYFQRTTTMASSGVVEIILYHYSPNLPTEHILSAAEETINFFEETVGVYPYAQLSIVETDMAGYGEKFSGIIFMDSNYLHTSQSLSILRHELGRQWFSVIIGGDPVQEPWLNRSLAYFWSSRLFQHDWPRNFPLNQYQQASFMFHALYQEIGEENFLSLLREYFRQYAFRIASMSDFIALAEEIHESSLQDFFDYWLNVFD